MGKIEYNSFRNRYVKLHAESVYKIYILYKTTFLCFCKCITLFLPQVRFEVGNICLLSKNFSRAVQKYHQAFFLWCIGQQWVLVSCCSTLYPYTVLRTSFHLWIKWPQVLCLQELPDLLHVLSLFLVWNDINTLISLHTLY